MAAATRYQQQAQAATELYDDPALSTGANGEDEDLSIGFRNTGMLPAVPNMEEEPSAAVPIGSPAENVNYYDPAYYANDETAENIYQAAQQIAGNQ